MGITYAFVPPGGRCVRIVCSYALLVAITTCDGYEAVVQWDRASARGFCNNAAEAEITDIQNSRPCEEECCGPFRSRITFSWLKKEEKWIADTLEFIYSKTDDHLL